MRWEVLVILLCVIGSVHAQELTLESRNWTQETLHDALVARAGGMLSEKHLEILADPATDQKIQAFIEAIDEREDPTAMARASKGEKLSIFLVHVDSTCDLSTVPDRIIRKRIVTENTTMLVVWIPRSLLSLLLGDECIIKIADAAHQEEFITYAETIMDAEAQNRLRALDMTSTSSDASNYDAIGALLEKDWDESQGKHSPLQEYVTPDAMSERGAPNDLYDLAVRWIWISDPTLFNETERWLTPHDFLALEPPETGMQSSDCEEHANTLVSLLRANGVSAKDVRVAIGEVEFEPGDIGGHAWAEIRQGEAWMVLDPTVGPWYDDASGTIIDRDALDFSYWQYHTFPVREVWAYYNDQYFLDLRGDHAPKSWDEDARSALGDELRKGAHLSLLERLVAFAIETIARFA